MKQTLISPLLIAALTICALSCSDSRLITIVKNGKPNAAIVLPENPSDHIRLAADILAGYIEKSTGTRLPVGSNTAEKGMVVIHLGEDTFVRNLNLDIRSLDDDGFVIAAPDGNNVVIAGPTDWGAEYGVYEFLERYVGVRWLMPGTDGEDVPRLSTITVPRETVRQEPAYFSRQLSAPNGDEYVRRNRHHGRVSFHHNLLRLFTASTYTKTHPEFFPIQDGKRYLPESDDDPSWQPCFSADGIVEEAVKNIKEYFKTHPEATSYSLGMNDSDHFCQCDKCLAKENPEKNFLGYRNYSDSYFEWANAVVEGVLKEYPDKWFGTLAYWNLAEPPKKVKVHPRIIPYMTYGRIRWFEPDLGAEGHRITEWWKSMSPTPGWYDYIYGTPYMVPRVFFHRMADYLRYGHKTGVRASYGEIYYNWGEGPKEYLTLKLLWNPDIDVDATLRDWYEHAVGKAAAPELEAYYKHWEQFWTGRIRQSSWYSKQGQWMRFNDPGYLDIVTENDIAQSRQWLEVAVAKAETKAQKKRAAYLLRAFEYYEASALSFMDELRAFKSPPATADEALVMLGTVERYGAMKEKRWELVDAFDSDPVLRMPIKPDRYRLTTGDRWGCYPLWAVYEWARSGDQRVSSRLFELSASDVPSIKSHARLMRGVLSGEVKPLTKNSAFDSNQSSWTVNKRGNATIVLAQEDGHNGRGALAVSGPGGVTLEQCIPLDGIHTRYTALGFVKVTGSEQSGAKVELALSVAETRVKDLVVDEWLETKDWQATSPSLRHGVWIPMATTIDVARIATEKKPSVLTLRLTVRDIAAGSRVFIDDAGLYRFGE